MNILGWIIDQNVVIDILNTDFDVNFQVKRPIIYINGMKCTPNILYSIYHSSFIDTIIGLNKYQTSILYQSYYYKTIWILHTVV